MIKNFQTKIKVYKQNVNNCEKDKKVFHYIKDDIKGFKNGFHIFNIYYY
jgi:hypothetical protein